MQADKTIGIIGMGVVGRSQYHALSTSFKVSVYDLTLPHTELKTVCSSSDIIFICVPVPTKKDGTGQDLSELVDLVQEAKSHNSNSILVVKSTLQIGGCRHLFRQTGVEVVYNPEFLTERNAITDVLYPSRIILGKRHNNNKNKEFTEVQGVYSTRFPGVPIVGVSWEEAELAKLAINSFFGLKISYMNELYRLCVELGIPSHNLEMLLTTDGRIAWSHLEVPGPDGKKGFGGKCLPKDMLNLLATSKYTHAYMNILEAAWETNLEVRPGEDWLDIPGAFV